MNLHFHLIGLDGWFHRAPSGELVFERAPTPTQQEVESVVLDLHARPMRLLERRGLLEVGPDDPLTENAPALAACYEGAVTQSVGLGPMKGRPVMKLGTSLLCHLRSASARVERGGQIPKPPINLVLYAGVLRATSRSPTQHRVCVHAGGGVDQ